MSPPGSFEQPFRPSALVPPGHLRPGAVVEVVGPASAGKLKLGHGWAARILARGDRVAWVDGPGTFYGPSAAADGVPLDNLLVVRPANHRLARACRILVASSVYTAVIVDLGPANLSTLPPSSTIRLWRLARRSGTCLYILVTGRDSLFAQRASVRLRHTFVAPRDHGFVIDRVRSVDAPTLRPGTRVRSPKTTLVEPAWYLQLPPAEWADDDTA